MLNKFLVIFSIILVSACKVSVISPERFNSKDELCKHIKSIANKTEEGNFIYKYKAEIVYQSKRFDVQGNIIKLSDSVLFVNAVSKTLGIEVARMKVTNTKVLFVNKLQKEYLIDDIDSLKSALSFQIDKSILSLILLGDSYNQKAVYDCDKITEQCEDQAKFFLFSVPFAIKSDTILCKWKEDDCGQMCWLNIYKSKNKMFTLTNIYNNFDNKNQIALKSNGKLLMQNFSCEYKLDIESVKKYKDGDVVINIPKSYKQIKWDNLAN